MPQGQAQCHEGQAVIEGGEQRYRLPEGQLAAEYEINMGKLGQPLRVAVTGGPVSPPIDVTLWLVGKTRTLARLNRALDFIRERIAGNND